MKVIHLHKNGFPSSGAAIMMMRLHHGLRQYGVESKILCANRRSDRDDLILMPRFPKVESFLGKLTKRIGLNDVNCISSFQIKKMRFYAECDVLHIHGIHGGFFSYMSLPGLTEKKPAIFTLHDSWAFTGHCAITQDCNRWQIGCGKCPYLDASPTVRRDATHVEWKLKEWVYNRSNLIITAPSHWLVARAKKSILKRFPIYLIPNAVDCKIYEPLDAECCRSILGIPKGKYVIMFAAMGLNHFDKGYDLLQKALSALSSSLKSETILLLLGTGGDTITGSLNIENIDLGYIANDRIKALAYSATDVFVSPSRSESFGLTILESMACATPVVAFRVGGVTDLVQDGVTGYLVEPENSNDLCDGIASLLENKPLRQRMGEECRHLALRNFSLDDHVQRFRELYNKVI